MNWSATGASGLPWSMTSRGNAWRPAHHLLFADSNPASRTTHSRDFGDFLERWKRFRIIGLPFAQRPSSLKSHGLIEQFTSEITRIGSIRRTIRALLSRSDFRRRRRPSSSSHLNGLGSTRCSTAGHITAKPRVRGHGVEIALSGRSYTPARG